MSKSLIYTANTSGATPAVGSTIPIGSIIRVLCCGDAALTISVGGTTAPTISNLSITVTRE